MAKRGTRGVGLASALVVALAGCGGSSEGPAASGEFTGGSPSLATLEVISTDVLSASGTGEFSLADSGDDLAVGDRVRTNEVGFAEVGFFDGSWARVESSATLEILALEDTAEGQVVESGFDRGRAWARVEELTESGDRFKLDTPVAQATVRGTAFAVECADDGATCTFSVVEGEVEVTPDGGDPILVAAGETLTVERDVEPPPPVSVGVGTLGLEPWIEKNVALDEQAIDDAGAEGGSDSSGDTASGDGVVLDGPFVLETTAVAGSIPAGYPLLEVTFDEVLADPDLVGGTLSCSDSGPVSESVLSPDAMDLAVNDGSWSVVGGRADGPLLELELASGSDEPVFEGDLRPQPQTFMPGVCGGGLLPDPATDMVADNWSSVVIPVRLRPAR